MKAKHTQRINSRGMTARYDRHLQTIWRWTKFGVRTRNGRVPFVQPKYINGQKLWDVAELDAWDEKYLTDEPVGVMNNLPKRVA